MALAVNVSPLPTCVTVKFEKAAAPFVAVMTTVVPVRPVLFNASVIATPPCNTLLPLPSTTCTTTLLMTIPTPLLAGCVLKTSELVAAEATDPVSAKANTDNTVTHAAARIFIVFIFLIKFPLIGVIADN